MTAKYSQHSSRPSIPNSGCLIFTVKVTSACCDDELVIGTEGCAGDTVRVALQHGHNSARRNIPDTRCMVSPFCRHQRSSIMAECQASLSVQIDIAQTDTCIPYPCCTVSAYGNYRLTVWAKRCPSNVS